jgi:hypothetical protein
MAIVLNLGTVVQSNDNTIIRIIDDTGIYAETTTGWGTPNTALSTINGSTNSLTITITITTSDGTETVYDPIDVYDYLGAVPTTVSELMVYVTPAILLDDGVALGAATDELPDGWYVIDYDLKIISTGVEISNTTVTCLVDGKVRNKIYDMLRTLPTDVYTSIPYRIYTHNWNELIYPLYVLSIFEAMVAYITTARKVEILNTLNVVERLTA